jgi:hypothetical protein
MVEKTPIVPNEGHSPEELIDQQTSLEGLQNKRVASGAMAAICLSGAIATVIASPPDLDLAMPLVQNPDLVGATKEILGQATLLGIVAFYGWAGLEFGDFTRRFHRRLIQVRDEKGEMTKQP